jgi:hypothetical protein
MRRAGDLIAPAALTEVREFPALATIAALATLASLTTSACHREAPIESCRDSLAGLWRVADGPTGDDHAVHASPVRRWALLDRGTRVEGYPLFDDTEASAEASAPTDLIRSPRSLALIRSHTSLVGHVERWVMRGAQKCALRASARIFACKSDVLDGVANGGAVDVISVQLGALVSPDDLTTCIAAPAPGLAAPAAPERWYREP